VYPRLGTLARRWVVRHREAFEGSQQRERRFGQMSGDFFGVRPWQQGDSRRWIHWRASARHGTLVVRQFERYRTRDVAVLVDLWHPDAPGPEHADAVELAVSFAATVVDDLCRKGAGELLVGIGGRQVQWAAGPASPALLQDALEKLAMAEGCAADQLPEMLEHAARHVDPAAEVILVSTRPEEEADGLPPLAASPAARAMAGRARRVSAAGEELGEYFVVE